MAGPGPGAAQRGPKDLQVQKEPGCARAPRWAQALPAGAEDGLSPEAEGDRQSPPHRGNSPAGACLSW